LLIIFFILATLFLNCLSFNICFFILSNMLPVEISFLSPISLHIMNNETPLIYSLEIERAIRRLDPYSLVGYTIYGCFSVAEELFLPRRR